uniref:Uncharacterized protein n=1 Tax=Ditylenchus dipsaci TaxID=166011 RepID=A0A915EQS3_9BILA
MSLLSDDSPNSGSENSKKRMRDAVWQTLARSTMVQENREKKKTALSAVLSIPSMPMNIILHPLMRRLFYVMSPKFEIPGSFSSLRSILQNQFVRMQAKIKDELSGLSRRFSLTCDLWTDSGLNNAYLTIEGSHTGTLIRRETEKILCIYVLSTANAFEVVTDGGRNMIKAFHEIRPIDVDPENFDDEEEEEKCLKTNLELTIKMSKKKLIYGYTSCALSLFSFRSSMKSLRKHYKNYEFALNATLDQLLEELA